MAKLIQVIETLTRVDAGNGQGYDAMQYFLPDGRMIGQDPMPAPAKRFDEADLRDALAKARAQLGDQARRADDAESTSGAGIQKHPPRQARASVQPKRSSQSEAERLRRHLTPDIHALKSAGFTYTEGAEQPWRPPVNTCATVLYRLLDQLEQWRTETNRLDQFAPLWRAVGAARQAMQGAPKASRLVMTEAEEVLYRRALASPAGQVFELPAGVSLRRAAEILAAAAEEAARDEPIARCDVLGPKFIDCVRKACLDLFRHHDTSIRTTKFAGYLTEAWDQMINAGVGLREDEEIPR